MNLEQQKEHALKFLKNLEKADPQVFADLIADDFADSNKVFTFAVVGHPVDKLIDYAKEQAIDLILLSTHGRSGAQHMVIGSVAEKVARNAPCSVLVFRPRNRA